MNSSGKYRQWSAHWRCTRRSLPSLFPPDKELYQRQIEATDRQIDALVYELYGLAEGEIEIVEGGKRVTGG
jgi:hypothetical protein